MPNIRGATRNLARIARELGSSLRRTDVIVRAFTDRLLVVLPGADEAVALAVLGRALVGERREVRIGAAAFPEDGPTWESLTDVAQRREQPWPSPCADDGARQDATPTLQDATPRSAHAHARPLPQARARDHELRSDPGTGRGSRGAPARATHRRPSGPRARDADRAPGDRAARGCRQARLARAGVRPHQATGPQRPALRLAQAAQHEARRRAAEAHARAPQHRSRGRTSRSPTIRA